MLQNPGGSAWVSFTSYGHFVARRAAASAFPAHGLRHPISRLLAHVSDGPRPRWERSVKSSHITTASQVPGQRVGSSALPLVRWNPLCHTGDSRRTCSPGGCRSVGVLSTRPVNLIWGTKRGYRDDRGKVARREGFGSTGPCKTRLGLGCATAAAPPRRSPGRERIIRPSSRTGSIANPRFLRASMVIRAYRISASVPPGRPPGRDDDS